MTQELNAAYDVLEELGRGRFGVVSRCRCRSTGSSFAVKSIDKVSVSNDAVDRQCLLNEPKILHHLSLSSPNAADDHHIAAFHAAYEDDSYLHLILDLFPFPSLYTVLSHRHHLSERESHAIFSSLLHAVLHCHLHGVIHRDIKPDNVLVDLHCVSGGGCGRIKLCDFGSAEFFREGEKVSGVFGTPYYVAPEVLGGGDYDDKVDVWSSGVILYVMLAGFPPFYGETASEIFEAVMRGNLRFPAASFRSVSPAARDLIRRMLCRDVSRRFSAEQVFKENFDGEGKLFLLDEEVRNFWYSSWNCSRTPMDNKRRAYYIRM